MNMDRAITSHSSFPGHRDKTRITSQSRFESYFGQSQQDFFFTIYAFIQFCTHMISLSSPFKTNYIWLQADFCTVCRTDCWWPLLYSWERSDTALTVRHAGCTVADRENCRGDEVSWKDHRMSFNLFGWDSKLLMSLQSKENHPGHHLFSQLPSGRRNIKSRTTLGKSFFPWAVKTLNTLKLNAANTELTSQV